MKACEHNASSVRVQRFATFQLIYCKYKGERSYHYVWWKRCIVNTILIRHYFALNQNSLRHCPPGVPSLKLLLIPQLTASLLEPINKQQNLYSNTFTLTHKMFSNSALFPYSTVLTLLVSIVFPSLYFHQRWIPQNK